ncbi:U2 small nuclear ribonucleoprotein auxiliary factor 35 kDa subunit- protein 2 [Entomophthora muscae]|uniref:U2 small nuclear ribonucleoprotein auxiliary factor 35 kDa subunit- protein 2 n=1 Tax=Entomophthora muscae TaxID=34485 RepID=A0ACC2U3K7_9FUNG|nr:U2 small nuclear ribonucleoprotein auxiliary factor 35 kDa subunit- protein 2 [Entomophthora muscae]
MDETKSIAGVGEAEDCNSVAEPFPELDLRTLLPKDRVSRLEYRRKKKAAKRKITRQLEAKIKIEQEDVLHQTKEYQEKIAEIEKNYKLRKEQWEAKEAKYARESVRRKEIEAVLKAQLSASLGKTSQASKRKNAKIIQFRKQSKLLKSRIYLQTAIRLFSRGPKDIQRIHTMLSKTLKTLWPLMNFFEDVFPELNRFGGVQDVKVSLNSAPHLRGNVYVLYSSLKSAQQSYDALKGRFYGGLTLLPRYLGQSSLRQTLCVYNINDKACCCHASCNL